MQQKLKCPECGYLLACSESLLTWDDGTMKTYDVTLKCRRCLREYKQKVTMRLLIDHVSELHAITG